MGTEKKVVLLRSNPVNPDPPVEKIANTLARDGYEVTIVAWDRESDYDIKESNIILSDGSVVKVVRFGISAVYGGGLKKTLKALLEFQFRLKDWLKKNKDEYNIIHAFDFDTGYVAKAVAKKYNKKFIYHILDFYVDSHPSGGAFLRKIVKNLELGVINFADATIICTEKRQEQITGSKPNKLVVIHNTPSDDIALNENLKIAPSDRLKIVYVGVFQEGRMLEELCQIAESNKNLELHIGGFGILEEKIKSYAEKNENIFFYGKLPYASTLALEKQCDIITAIYDPSVPNHKYAAPNKFYEALMLGKPVIMAKNTGFDEVMEKEQIGILIDYTKESLLNNLEIFLERKNFWRKISQQTRALYEKKYRWTEMEKRLNEIYEFMV